MRSVVIANSSDLECGRIQRALRDDYNLRFLSSPDQGIDLENDCDLILLDHNFTEYSGIDFLAETLQKIHVPVLMVTPLSDPHHAIEAMRLGAYNYLVKTDGYHDLLKYSIREAIDKFNELKELKKTILALKRRVTELEKHIENLLSTQDVDFDQKGHKSSLIEAITLRFKRGEINLPAYAKINKQFRRLIEAGASLEKIADLLKQDIVISSKLLSISNSPYYCGLAKNKTLEQAISRMGVKTARNYVEIISNRSLYTTNNQKYRGPLKKLWEHSLACGYASEMLSNRLQIRMNDELFTMGLLHDIGKLLLLQIVIEIDSKSSDGRDIEGSDVNETLDTYHGLFGASLLKKWEFPSEFAHIAQYHHRPDEAGTLSKELMIVHLANLISKALGYGLHGTETLDLEHAASARFFDLPLSEIIQVEERVKQLMENSVLFQ